MTPVLEPARPVDDVVSLTVMILGLQWIPMEKCPPPVHMDFLALTLKRPGDYAIEHCVFDGTGREGLEKVTHWFPLPRLPKRAVEGFPPHDQALGDKLKRSLLAWIKERA